MQHPEGTLFSIHLVEFTVLLQFKEELGAVVATLSWDTKVIAKADSEGSILGRVCLEGIHKVLSQYAFVLDEQTFPLPLVLRDAPVAWHKWLKFCNRLKPCPGAGPDDECLVPNLWHPLPPMSIGIILPANTPEPTDAKGAGLVTRARQYPTPVLWTPHVVEMLQAQDKSKPSSQRLWNFRNFKRLIECSTQNPNKLWCSVSSVRQEAIRRGFSMEEAEHMTVMLKELVQVWKRMQNESRIRTEDLNNTIHKMLLILVDGTQDVMHERRLAHKEAPIQSSPIFPFKPVPHDAEDMEEEQKQAPTEERVLKRRKFTGVVPPSPEDNDPIVKPEPLPFQVVVKDFSIGHDYATRSRVDVITHLR
jgi:hypothetical protein